MRTLWLLPLLFLLVAQAASRAAVVPSALQGTDRGSLGRRTVEAAIQESDLPDLSWSSRCRVQAWDEPTGIVDGPNLYAYVRQNPWTHWDPLGLADEGSQGIVDRFLGWLGRGVVGLMENSPGKVAQAMVDNATDAILSDLNRGAQSPSEEIHFRPFKTDPHGSASDGAELATFVQGGALMANELSQGQPPGKASRTTSRIEVVPEKTAWTISQETDLLMKSPEFAKLTKGQRNGKMTRVTINGRTIQYDPGLPSEYSGMTMGDNGFVIGDGAFKSPEELQKTVTHELHRLRTSEIKKSGQVGVGDNTSETKAAYDAAENAHKELSKQPTE